MSALAASNRETARLANIAARLASDHEGERAAAALVATREPQSRGVSWAEVIERGLRPLPALRPSRPPPPRKREPSTPAVMAKLEWVIHYAWTHVHDPREQVHLIRLLDSGGPFTPADLRYINAVTQRMEAACGVRCGQEVPL